MKRTKIYSRFESRKKWKRYIAPLLVLVLVAVTATFAVYANKYSHEAADQKTKYENSQTEKLKLDTQLNEMKQEQVEQDDAHKQELQKLQDENKSLNDQLQAKIEQKAKLAAAEKEKVVATSAPVAKTYAPQIAAGCGSNSFSQYIYAKESGCNLTVTNAEGCIGIGQACPASKLLAVCPTLDLVCQDNFFTGYAISRYGSWEGAYNAWLTQHWW